MRAGLEPRAPPGREVYLSAEFRALILETYPLPVGMELLLNIETHLDLLNSQSRSRDATEFLRDCETGARAEVRKRSREKSRNALTLIGTSTFTASLSVAVKYLGTKLGIS